MATTQANKVGATNAGRDDHRSVLRRRDRGKDDAWVAAFLRRAAYGFLATVGQDGQPFLNSNLFVFDDTGGGRRIYLHTHRTGRTRDNLEGAEKVAFSATAMGRLLPAPEALEFSVEYAGVVAFGAGRVVEDRDEARTALQMLLDKYAPHLKPGIDYRPTTDEELRRTAVYRIDIESWSGKQKEVAEDFPGAFTFEFPPVPFPKRGMVRTDDRRSPGFELGLPGSRSDDERVAGKDRYPSDSARLTD